MTTTIPDPFQSDQLDANAQANGYQQALGTDQAVAQSAQLTSYRKLAPGMPPTALLSFLAAGVDPNSDQFTQLSKLFLPNSYDDVMKYGLTPTQHKLLRSAPPQVQASARDLYGDALQKVRSQGGWSWNPLSLPGELLHGFTEEVAKPVVRGTALAFQTGYEGLQAGYRAASLIPGLQLAPSLLGAKNDKSFGGDIGEALQPWNELTVYQGLAHGKSFGTGWFPQAQASMRTVGFDQNNKPTQVPVDSATSAAAGAARGAASIAGRAVTPGRLNAAVVTEPGTAAYNAVSGMVDAANALKDPTATGLQGFVSSVRGARTAFAVGPEALGAYQGLRKFVHSPTASQWLDTGKGQRLTAELAHETNARKIMQVTGWKWDPEVADQIAKADNATDVRNILEGHLGTDIPTIPRVGRLTGPGGLPYTLTYPLRNARFFQDFPGRVLDMEDPNAFVKNLNDYLSNAKVPESQIDRVVNDTISAFGDYSHSSANGAQYAQATLSSRLFGIVKDAEEQIHQKVAGQAWWSSDTGKAVDKLSGHYADTVFEGQSAQHLIDGIMSAARGPDDPAPMIRDALEHNFGGRTTTSGRSFDEVADEAAHMAAAHDRSGLVSMLQGEFPMGHSYATDAVAKRMTSFADSSRDLKTYAVDADSPGFVQHIAADGENIPIDGVHLSAELARRAFLLTDPRDIHRTVSKFAPLFVAKSGDARLGGKVVDALAALQQNVWRPLTVLRGALTVRILAEEQAAMANAGMDSMFRHPFGYIAHTIGVQSDLLGKPFADQLADRGSTWARALATGYSADADRIALAGFGKVVRGKDENFLPSWADEINRLHAAPEARAAAQAILDDGGWSLNKFGADGPAVTAFKQALWNGELAPLRAAVYGNAPYGWRSMLNTEEGSNAWADSILQRVSKMTAEDPKLTEAVSKGVLDGAVIGDGQSSSAELARHLRKLDRQDVAPDVVKGKVFAATRAGGDAGSRTMERLKAAEDSIWNRLVGVPSARLSRSPIYRQAYYDELGRLFPAMDYETQQHVLQAMHDNGLDSMARDVAGHAPATGASALNVASADLLASHRALGSVRRLTYDLHNRKQWSEALRTLSPFADAWRQIATRWAGLALENGGQIVHRTAQATAAARTSGFFYSDPATGKEMFVIPGTGWLEQHFTGYDMGGFAAPVQGLNLVTAGMPGLGPAGTIALDKLLPNVPAADQIRSILTPYGEPDVSHGMAEAFFPGWLSKIVGAGALNWTGVFHGGHEQDQRQFASNYAQATTWLMAHDPNKYQGAATPDGAAALHKDATDLAQKLQTLQGLVQWAAPAVPHARFLVNAPKGTLEDPNDHTPELFTIQDDYRKLQTEAIAKGGDPNLATQQFVDRYGPDLMLAMVPQSAPTVYGLSPTTQSEQWQATHGKIVAKFPDVWPLVAPQLPSDKFSYFEYANELGAGERMKLTVDQRMDLAQYRVGAMLYDQSRSKYGRTPTAGQRVALANIRNAIGARFPGYGKFSFQEPPWGNQKIARDAAAAQLAQAAKEPGVDPALATAIATYTAARDHALATIGPTAASAALQGKHVAGVRAQLRSLGEQLVQSTPAFAPAWENLFSREVEEPVTLQPTETLPS